jgi:hypothetical protein
MEERQKTKVRRKLSEALTASIVRRSKAPKGLVMRQRHGADWKKLSMAGELVSQLSARMSGVGLICLTSLTISGRYCIFDLLF